MAGRQPRLCGSNRLITSSEVCGLLAIPYPVGLISPRRGARCPLRGVSCTTSPAVSAQHVRATAVEYGLIAGFIAMVCISAFTAIGTKLSTRFNTIARNLS